MKRKLPLVSVIVPCYNHEKYVQECIESVVNQTYKNIELIVIDDGSSDNSPKILQDLSKKYNFCFEHQKNRGLSGTLNKALELTSGKYICNLASDDYWELTKIEKQVSIMEANQNLGFCYSDYTFVDKNSNPINENTYFKNITGYAFRRMLISNFVAAVTVMIRKDVFSEVGAYDAEMPIEDWYMWLKITKKYPIQSMGEKLAFYRMHGKNFSSDHKKMLNYELKIISLWKKEAFTYLFARLNAYRRFLKLLWKRKDSNDSI